MKSSFLKVIGILLFGIFFSLISCKDNPQQADEKEADRMENLDQRQLDEMEIDREARDDNTDLSDQEAARNKKIRESATTEDIKKAQNRLKEADEKLQIARKDGDPEVIETAKEEKRKAEEELQRALKKSDDKGEALKKNIER